MATGSSLVASPFGHDTAAAGCMGSVEMLTGFISRGAVKERCTVRRQAIGMSTGQTVSKVVTC